MLTEKIKASIDSIETKAKLQSQKLSNEKLSERLLTVAALGKKIETFIDIVKVMREEQIGCMVRLAEDKKDALACAVSDCGQKISDFSLDDATVTVLKMQTEVIDGLLTIQWKEAAEKHSSETVNYLSVLCDLTKNPQSTSDLLAQIKADASSRPTSTSVTRLKKNTKLAQAMIEQYRPDTEIQSFLTKVKNKQATIDDLTPEVVTWLKENNLTKKLLVSF